MVADAGDRDELLYGYLDLDAAGASRALDTVRIRLIDHPDPVVLRPHPLGVLRTCDISGAGGVRVRSRPRPADPAERLLGVTLSGQGWLEQEEQRVPLAPGGFVLYNGGRPFRLSLTGGYRYFLLRFPADALMTEVPADPYALPHAGGGVPSARLLAALLTELALQADRLDTVTGQEIADHVTALVRTVVRDDARSGRADTEPTPLLQRVLRYVDEHLTDSSLAPDTIARAHHVSTRSLHKLFQAQGRTVLGHVRQRRLEQIRRDLADPALADIPVQRVAARWGMHDASHFGKVFRAAYGVSPSEFRRTALRRAPLASGTGGRGAEGTVRSR